MVRWTEAEYQMHMAKKGAPKPKTRKYRNQPTEIDGIRFDSKREAHRWLQLKLEEKAGRITNLRRQVAYGLAVNGEHICKYIADFTYVRDGETVVEDVKSPASRTDVYMLKRRLMAAVHGITISEVV
jgi:hypothetical protein